MVKIFCRYLSLFLLVGGTALSTFAVLAATGPTVTDTTVFIGPEQDYSNAEVWPVYCEPNSTACTLSGQPKSIEQLAQQMPIATWGYCGGFFCYGDRSESDVIGLNPLYFH